MYRHIIWDWNGTLFDDAWLCLDIINGLLSKRALPTITAEQYEHAFGFPVTEYYRKIGFTFDQEPFEQISTAFIMEYERRRASCQLRSGAQRAINQFKHAGFSQSIISASKQAFLDGAVDQFDIRDRFTSISGLDNHHASGKLDLALNWITFTNIDPQEILLIGDTIHDYEVAQLIGVDCILIYSGHQNKERLMECGTILIQNLAELSEVLEFSEAKHE
jgi:phosphoglycolate phosphatase